MGVSGLVAWRKLLKASRRGLPFFKLQKTRRLSSVAEAKSGLNGVYAYNLHTVLRGNPWLSLELPWLVVDMECFDVTLLCKPCAHMQILASDLIDKADFYRGKFDSAKPFRHVLITPFFDSAIAEAMLQEFPVPLESQMRGEVGEKCRKFACHDVRSIGPTYRLVDDYISSPEFARVMERVTGIQNLLYDPEYHGGGTHDNLSGQAMFAHVDFNLHHATGYHRRINAIIYLNKEWNEQWGGNLELHTDPWDFENDQIVSYPPLFNHCILFETNEHSWHGFQTVQAPDGRELSRKSFTIYMYTKDRPAEEIAPKHWTRYVLPGPPKHFQAGYTLSAEDVQKLKLAFEERNGFLQVMYGRESRLLTRVEELIKAIDHLKKMQQPALEPARK